MIAKSRTQFHPRKLTRTKMLMLTAVVAVLGNLGREAFADDLLRGAHTVVPAIYNAHLGYSDTTNPVQSAVTAIRFHIPGVPSHERMSKVPIGVKMVEHGVRFTEYSGELSGYSFTSSISGIAHDGYFRNIYGSIDEDGIDHSHDADPGNFTQKTSPEGMLVYLDRYGELALYDSNNDAWFRGGEPISPWDYLPFIPVATQPVHERFGLRGINFILKVPTRWNGVLLHFMHGNDLYSGADSGYPFLYNFDENLLLDRGYAFLTINGSGRTPANSNHRMEPALQNYFEFLVNPLDEKPQARVAEGYSVYGLRPCRGMNCEPMALRDISAVFSNLLKSVTSREVKRKYYSTWSHSGGTAGLAMSWGVTWGGLHFGGNHRVPYDNTSAPIYDGFIHFDPSYWTAYYVEPDPAVPMSPAPVMIYTGANSMTDVPGGDDQISFTGALFAAKSHRAGNRTKDTIFFYTMENLPHIGYEVTFAIEKNGGGWFFDETTFSVNQDGVGREMNSYWSRLVDILGPQGFSDTGLIYWPALTKDAPRDMGLYLQLLKNLDLYLESGIKQPRSIIDPYWIKGSGPVSWPRNPWPEAQKFPLERFSGAAQDTAVQGHYNLFELLPLYADVAAYIESNDVLDYNAQAVRLPDDAARRGIYVTDGYVETYTSIFSRGQLRNGIRTLDWNGEELVTLRMPDGRKIPGDGYGSHEGYVAAVSHAVQNLVSIRLFDLYLGMKLIEEATQYDVLKNSP